MKKTGKVLLGMFAFAICLFGYSFDSLAAEGTVIPGSAKIRSDASTSSEALASVEQGDEVSIKAKTTGADGKVWYQVFVDADTLGFIRSDLVKFDGTVGEVTLTATQSDTAAAAEEAEENTAGNTDSADAGSTAVESMPNQGATITGGDVNVRAGAGTSTQKVTKAANGTAITVTGKATGSDGKVWYQATFIADGKEITGFIRSDYVELGEIIEQPVEEEPETEAEEPEAPAPSTENKAYDTVLETKEDGTQEWYLYDNAAGFKYSIPDLMAVTQNNEDIDSAQEKQFKQQKIIIIVLVVLIIVLVLGLTLLVFKMHESEGYDEEDEEDEETFSQPPVRRRKVEGAPEKQPVRRPAQGSERPQQQRRPVQQDGNAQRRPAPTGNVQRRPSSGRTAEGRPVAGQGKPVSRPVRNAEGEPVRRPVQNGEKPNPQRAAQKPKSAAPKMPEREVTFEEEPKLDVKKNQNGQWHSKNFLADDDEFEFEFLNMDDPNRL